MTFKQWDIILVPFPFTNLKGMKKRPALIISPDQYNTIEDDIIIAFLTSNTKQEDRIGDYHLKKWKSSGLPKPTKFKLKLATIIQTQIIKRIGSIKSIDQKNIQGILIKSIQGDL
jgi:mRNA interferase MazF